MLRSEDMETRKQVIRQATALMQKLNLKAYIRGEYPGIRKDGKGSFGIERAMQDYIERENGHGRMAMIARMVRLREKRVSTIPPDEFSDTAPLSEDIQIK